MFHTLCYDGGMMQSLAIEAIDGEPELPSRNK